MNRAAIPLAAALLVATAGLAALGQVPGGPASAVPPPRPRVIPPGGPVRRAANHAGYVVHDQLVGDPRLFDVPPLGYDLYRTMAAQTAKAQVHVFTLYNSDFLAGTDQLSPGGAWRL